MYSREHQTRQKPHVTLVYIRVEEGVKMACEWAFCDVMDLPPLLITHVQMTVTPTLLPVLAVLST